MKFETLKQATSNAINTCLNNYSVDNKKIVLNSIKFGDKDLDKKMAWSSVQKEKNKNGTLSIPIYGDISIKDGKKLVSRDKRVNIGQLPVVTKNDSVLVDGIEYIVPWQLRRDPGVYTSQSANGTWYSAINSAKGRNFKIESQPLTNIQRIEIDGTRIPLLPILHQFGISKEEIIKTWGNNKDARDIYELNHQASQSATGRKALQTLYKKLIYNAKPNASEHDMKLALFEYMKNNSEFRPEVNELTLGKSHKTLSPGIFLDISKRLITAAKEEKGDDTENLIFKHVRTAEDLIQERIKLDFKKKLTASLNRNLKNFKNVKDIVRPGFFTKSIKAFFNESKISEPSEQINPLHVLNTASKITIKGEGGITDEHTVSIDMKSLHPSHMGLIDPLHTPDGNAGLVNHLATRAGFDRNTGKLQTYYYNKAGKIKIYDIKTSWNSKVATPDQYIIKPGRKPYPKTSKIKVTFKGENQIVPSSQVDLILAHATQLFDPAVNMIPFINSNSGNRISMGGKMAEQSISLVNREAPHVSTASAGRKEIIEIIGKETCIKSPVNGTVRKVTPSFIEIKGRDGKMYKEDLRNHMELNQESFYHDVPVVKLGQKVKLGEVIAKNNWVDPKGRLSLGVNARVAYMPYQGYSIEDGIVVSDSFARKLTSQHVHVEEVNIKEGGLNLNKFKQNFKNKYTLEAFSKLDDNGIVKKGSKVEKGNILVAYAKPFVISEEDKVLKKAMRGFKNRLIDQSIVWNYDFPGDVVDVIKTGNLVKVKVRSHQAADITDKLTNRFGGKGVISKIIPDGDMPRTSDGKPLEILLNPHGVASRINVGQLLEASLGKITEKTGKRYVLENYQEPDNWQYVSDELKKHGISDTEKVIDPVSGKEIKTWNPVKNKYEYPFVGNTYIQKLVHQTRKKFDARGRGAYSTIDMPGKDPEASHYIGESSSKENPKSIDRLTLYSLLSHGAKDVINDMWNNKGQNRADVWDAIITGSPIPPPKVSTATKKLFSLFNAAGINVERKGRFLTFKPLTDKDTLSISGGKIPKPNMFLRGKDLMPIKGGMFDPMLTGSSHNSDVFNHIDLNTKVPNPIAKNAIKHLLDISDDDFENIMKGNKTVDGLNGIEFFEKKLKDIKVDSEIDRLEKEKKKAGKTKLNEINRKLRYLKALKTGKIRPEEYLISKVPVIPTKFRPILPLPNGTIEPAPINHLYRNIAIANKLTSDKTLPPFLRKEALFELYKQVSDMQGVTEPVSQDPKRTIKSVLTELAGYGSPKGGFLHSKILSKTQDYIGNSVIGVGPDLGVDEIGIPFKMAEVMYEPFILRELRKMGYKATDFKRIKKEKPALIKSVLEKIVKERPVVVNRNPSLHKGSTFGFNPKLVEGSSIKLNPLILKPLGADFDGDQVPVHVPISQKAVEQVKGMIPSLNVLSPKNDSFQINFDQEYIAGLSLMTEDGKKTSLKFENIKTAEEAYKANRIRISDKIKIAGKTTTLGRALLVSALPAEFGYKGDRQLTKPGIEELMKKMVSNGSVSRYTDVINKLKNFGAQYSYDEGFSFSLEDIKPRKDIRAKYLLPAIPGITKDKDDASKVVKIKKASEKAQDQLHKEFTNEHNRFYLPSKFGSRRLSKDVLMQITASPFYVAGTQDRLVQTPISKSYSEGLDLMDNFNASYGARKAIVDKVQSVSDPGALSKELVASFSGEVITMHDCGTNEGIIINIGDTFNLQNRVLAKSVNGLPHNTILDKNAINQLRKGKEKNILVRSPLKCKAYKGVCAMCYGMNEMNAIPKIGDPIGLKAAQSIGETGTQSALSSHHLGGTVSAGSFRSGFQQTKFLLHMPDQVKNKAILVEKAGTISRIEKGIGNQSIVFISNNPEPYIVRNKLIVKKGQKVQPGDPLEQGLIKLQELAELVPMNKVQEYMTQQLEQSYAGTKILRRNTETIVRGVTGYAKVTNPGKSPYLEEELVPVNLVAWIKEGRPINVDDAIGWHTKRTYAGYPAGTQITIDMAHDLLRKGIKEVVVDAEGLEFKNKLMGINTIPLHQPDILKRLSFQRIRAALKEGPVSGAYSNVHGRYPEPALTIGTEFGMPGYEYY